jgi:cytochrome oxidase Cu insertion factor (SCO1/SenC/PrrC family)
MRRAPLVGVLSGLVLVVALSAAIDAVAGEVEASVWEALALDRPSQAVEAPAFELRDLAGRAVALKDLRGRVVMLYFWTTW